MSIRSNVSRCASPAIGATGGTSCCTTGAPGGRLLPFAMTVQQLNLLQGSMQLAIEHSLAEVRLVRVQYLNQVDQIPAKADLLCGSGVQLMKVRSLGLHSLI